MSGLRAGLRDYLTLRRKLGYTLKETEWLLTSFVAWLDEHGETHITTAQALAWATRPAGADRRWHQRRLGVARGFATGRQ